MKSARKYNNVRSSCIRLGHFDRVFICLRAAVCEEYLFLFSFYRCDLRQLLRKGHIPLVGYYIKHSMEIALGLFFHRLDNLRL